jgi:hypothetical protein
MATACRKCRPVHRRSKLQPESIDRFLHLESPQCDSSLDDTAARAIRAALPSAGARDRYFCQVKCLPLKLTKPGACTSGVFRQRLQAMFQALVASLGAIIDVTRMDDPSIPATRWRTIIPTSGVSAVRRLNSLIVSEVNPATFARNSQFIMRLPNGSVAGALAPPAD